MTVVYGHTSSAVRWPQGTVGWCVLVVDEGPQPARVAVSGGVKQSGVVLRQVTKNSFIVTYNVGNDDDALNTWHLGRRGLFE